MLGLPRITVFTDTQFNLVMPVCYLSSESDTIKPV